MVLRSIIRRFLPILFDEYCAVHIDWTWGRCRWNKVNKIHWCYTRALWRKRKLYSLASVLLWPLKAVLFTVKRTRQYGVQVSRKTGVTIHRQFLEQLYLAFRYFIPPKSYYIYSLYESDNRARAALYIHHHEILELLPFLNISSDTDVLEDKRRFDRECTKLGLPTNPILAEFEAGVVNTGEASERPVLPHQDLFAKPAFGVCGHGVRVYSYSSASGCYYASDQSEALTSEKLLAQLSGISVRQISGYARPQPYILQRRLYNHPDMSRLSTGALCTARIVTGKPPGGCSEHLCSVVRMPTGHALSDNFASGGIASPVDAGRGRLGSAIAKDPKSERVDFHPNTGERIVGFQLPFWGEAVRLCLCAHDASPQFAFVGWDVAITSEGPVLVEANPTWGVESVQKAHDQPLGSTRFTDIFLAHIGEQRDPNLFDRESRERSL